MVAKLLARPRTLLTQAKRGDLPVVERLRALGIMAQSIDNIFTADQGDAGPHSPASTNRHGQESPAYIATLLQEAARLMRQQILPLLAKQRVRLLSVEMLGEQQHSWLFDYFQQRIYPLLTPLAVDPGHPFPYISSESLNLLVLLQRPERSKAQPSPLYARLKVPRQVVPRLIDVPPLAQVDSPVLHHDADHKYWVWSEDVVRFFVHELFAGMSVTGIYQFRVLRAPTPTHTTQTQSQLPARLKAPPVVRLDVQQEMPPAVVQWLATQLDVPPQAIFRYPPPLGMGNLFDLAEHLETLWHPA
jgi:polyphosphate kinase